MDWSWDLSMDVYINTLQGLSIFIGGVIKNWYWHNPWSTIANIDANVGRNPGELCFLVINAEFSKSDRLHSLAVIPGTTDMKQIIGGYRQAWYETVAHETPHLLRSTRYGIRGLATDEFLAPRYRMHKVAAYIHSAHKDSNVRDVPCFAWTSCPIATSIPLPLGFEPWLGWWLRFSGADRHFNFLLLRQIHHCDSNHYASWQTISSLS